MTLTAHARLGLLTVLTLLALAACGGNEAQRIQTETLDAWEAHLRWSQFDGLIDFIHPDYLAANPIAQLDVDRLHQFRVTGYRVRQILVAPDGESLERVARVQLYHVHSARERVIDHREIWRYDAERKAWLMHSGLPDPRQR